MAKVRPRRVRGWAPQPEGITNPPSTSPASEGVGGVGERGSLGGRGGEDVVAPPQEAATGVGHQA